MTFVLTWHRAGLLFHHIRHRKWNVLIIQAWLNSLTLTLLCLCSLSRSLFFWSGSADSNLSSVKHFRGCIRHYLQGAHASILYKKGKYLNMGVGWKEVFGKPVWKKLNTSLLGVKLKENQREEYKSFFSAVLALSECRNWFERTGFFGNSHWSAALILGGSILLNLKRF